MTLVAVLTGCASGSPDAAAEPGPGQRRLTASDDSFTVDVPDSWAAREQYLRDHVVVAAQGEDRIDQLLVSTFDGAGAAEDQAIYTAAGLAGGGIACRRLEQSPAFGDPRLVFDCPQQADGSTVRRLFVPVEHGGASILVFVQTSGETLATTAGTVRPILESLSWR